MVRRASDDGTTLTWCPRWGSPLTVSIAAAAPLGIFKNDIFVNFISRHCLSGENCLIL